MARGGGDERRRPGPRHRPALRPHPLSFTNGGLRVALHTTGALPIEATAIEVVEPEATPEDVV
jgi:hypothetical protein